MQGYYHIIHLLDDEHPDSPYDQTASKAGQYLRHGNGMLQSVDLVVRSDLRNADRFIAGDVAGDNNSFGEHVELVGLKLCRGARALREHLVWLTDVIIRQRQQLSDSLGQRNEGLSAAMPTFILANERFRTIWEENTTLITLAHIFGVPFGANLHVHLCSKYDMS